MKKSILFLSVLVIGLLTFNSCKKEYDNPPLKQVNDGAQLFVQQLKLRVPNSPSSYKMAGGDTNLYATVIADELSGNIYKQIFVKDATGAAIQINLVNSGGLYVGDKIRINLNNKYLVNANNMIYIDSVDVEKSVVKISTGNAVAPKVVTLSQVLLGTSPTSSNSLQSQLIQLNDVEFSSLYKGVPYADAIGKASLNRLITACGSGSSTLTVRTSGYANFASKLTPTGNGSMIAIVTQYNSTMQLTIRNYNEVQMNGSGCPTPTYQIGTPVSSINEDFNSIAVTNQVYANTGWLNIAQDGNAVWKTDINGATKTLKATAFGSGDASTSMWLITPPVIYTNTMTLSFTTAFGFWDSGHPNAIMAYVSTNYDGTNLNTANWTAVPASYANGTGNFYPNGSTNSGTITLNSIGILSGYSGNFFVGFKYTGTAGSFDSNIYLDNVLVQ
jgi:hypothetical protein